MTIIISFAARPIGVILFLHRTITFAGCGLLSVSDLGPGVSKSDPRKLFILHQSG